MKKGILLCMMVAGVLLPHKVYGMTEEMLNQRTMERYEVISDEETYSYLGDFTITFYCDCEICNGKWTGLPAANGESLKDGYTIAVDPKVIPLNTWVEIDGLGEFKACDTGSAIKGKRIDVFVNDHQKALELGKKRGIKVWKIKN